jgi:hypothetical protein
MSEQVRFGDELQKLIKGDPFIPFSLIFSSGDRYTVSDPGMAFSNDEVVIIFQPKTGSSYFRKNQIVGFETPVAKTRSRHRRGA